jgi:glycerol-3-phosphate acyltransferase PlsY
VAIVAVAALLGHVFTVFLRFQGGKGVATGLGVLLGLAPAAASVSLAIFVVTFAWRRIVSLASIGASAAAPVVIWLFGYPQETVLGAAAIAAVVIVRHRENLERLVAGTEERFHTRDA